MQPTRKYKLSENVKKKVNLFHKVLQNFWWQND